MMNFQKKKQLMNINEIKVSKLYKYIKINLDMNRHSLKF